MKFYLTFGCAHPFRNNWVEIEVDTYEAARLLAFENFGRKWATLYDKEEFSEARESFPKGKIGETLK